MDELRGYPTRLPDQDRFRSLDPHGDFDALHTAWVELAGKSSAGVAGQQAQLYLRTQSRGHDERRCEKRRYPAFLGSRIPSHGASPGPDFLAEQSETRQVVKRVVLSLTPQDCLIIRLRFYDGLSPLEIAELLHRPKQTVHTQLRRLLVRLSNDPLLQACV